MPVTNALVLYPVRFALPTYTLRMTAGGFPETVGPIGVNTSGRNYWMSGDTQADTDGGVGGVGDLVDMLRSLLELHVGAPVFTVSLTSTFRLSITMSSNFIIDWAHVGTTIDPTLFGFTAAATALGTSAESPNIPKGIFWPNRFISRDSRDQQPVVTGSAVSLNGSQRTVRMALPKKERDFEFHFLNESKVLTEFTPSTEPYGAFEYCWLDALTQGRPIRYYGNEGVRTPSSYSLYSWRHPFEEPWERDSSNETKYNVNLKLRKLV